MSEQQQQDKQKQPPRYEFTLYRVLVAVLLLVFVGLQYRLWISDGSMAEVHRLRQVKQELQAQVKQAHTRNEALAAEIENLKSGKEAMIGRARSDIGMIKKNETFFLTVGPLAGDEPDTVTPPSANDDKQ